MKDRQAKQESNQGHPSAISDANLTNISIAITTSKLQANYAIGPKRYAEHLQQIAGGYYQVDKNLSICLAARSKPAIEDTNSPGRSQSRWHRRSHEGIEQSSGGNR